MAMREVQAAMALGVSAMVMMTMEEARACVERVKAGIEQMRRDLLELREREGWKALGYPSWRACVVAGFGVSMATVYRQLEAAAIERDLSQVAYFLPQLATIKRYRSNLSHDIDSILYF